MRTKQAELPDEAARTAERLDEEQAKAVETAGHCLVSACPGSGKSRVLGVKGAALLRGGPGALCAVTFTREAAEELKRRILEEATQAAEQRVLAGTFHSLALQQLTRHAEARKERRPRVAGNEVRGLIARAMGETAYEGSLDEAVKVVEEVKSRVELNGAPAELALVERYNALLEQQGVLDFQDILRRAIRLMRDGVMTPLRVAWMVVDEAQDMDDLQYEWVRCHSSIGVEITMVGDDDQCHPGSTRILTDLGWFTLGELFRMRERQRPGVCWFQPQIKSGDCQPLRKGGRAIFARRPYGGSLIRVKAGDCQLEKTPAHRCLARFASAAKCAPGVVLLQGGDSFVLAMTDIVDRSGNFLAAIRRRFDWERLWLLGFGEQSESMFQQCHGAIEALGFKSVATARDRGWCQWQVSAPENIAAAAGVSLDAPFAIRDHTKRGTVAHFLMRADQLLPGLFEVPVVEDGAARTRWAVVEQVEKVAAVGGEVYSLDLRPRPYYVADGMVTHNSIYGFRYARGYRGLMEFQQRHGAAAVVLHRNYRSRSEILRAASRMIAMNSSRIAKSPMAMRGSGGSVTVQCSATRDGEALSIATTVASEPARWCVIARTNHVLDSVELACNGAGVLINRAGGGSVWSSGAPALYLGLLDALESDHAENLSKLLAQTGVVSRGSRPEPEEASASAWLRRCRSDYESAVGPAADATPKRSRVGEFNDIWCAWRELVTRGRESLVVSAVGGWLKRHLRDDEEVIVGQCERTLAALPGSLSARVRHVRRRAQRHGKAGVGAVTLMTAHASKGLEFDRVWVLGCEEGLFPHMDGEVEEERRLMYVAMTRAREELILSYTIDRGVRPSRFLRESRLIQGTTGF